MLTDDDLRLLVRIEKLFKEHNSLVAEALRRLDDLQRFSVKAQQCDDEKYALDMAGREAAYSIAKDVIKDVWRII